MNCFRIYKRVNRFSFFRKKEEYHLDGEITFLNNRILVNDKVYILDAIETIRFLNFDDYKGRVTDASENIVSEGVNNVIELKYSGEETVLYYFQMEQRHQIRDLREQLIQYHIAGKLDFENLISLLGLHDFNAIENFKKELPKGGSVRSY